jgi:hypothetical protein
MDMTHSESPNSSPCQRTIREALGGGGRQRLCGQAAPESEQSSSSRGGEKSRIFQIQIRCPGFEEGPLVFLQTSDSKGRRQKGKGTQRPGTGRYICCPGGAQVVCTKSRPIQVVS